MHYNHRCWSRLVQPLALAKPDANGRVGLHKRNSRPSLLNHRAVNHQGVRFQPAVVKRNGKTGRGDLVIKAGRWPWRSTASGH